MVDLLIKVGLRYWEIGGRKDLIQGVLHIKKSAELENHYAIYEFVDATKSGICPIEDLWKFVKAIKK